MKNKILLTLILILLSSTTTLKAMEEELQETSTTELQENKTEENPNKENPEGSTIQNLQGDKNDTSEILEPVNENENEENAQQSPTGNENEKEETNYLEESVIQESETEGNPKEENENEKPPKKTKVNIQKLQESKSEENLKKENKPEESTIQDTPGKEIEEKGPSDIQQQVIQESKNEENPKKENELEVIKTQNQPEKEKEETNDLEEEEEVFQEKKIETEGSKTQISKLQEKKIEEKGPSDIQQQVIQESKNEETKNINETKETQKITKVNILTKQSLPENKNIIPGNLETENKNEGEKPSSIQKVVQKNTKVSTTQPPSKLQEKTEENKKDIVNINKKNSKEENETGEPPKKTKVNILTPDTPGNKKDIVNINIDIEGSKLTKHPKIKEKPKTIEKKLNKIENDMEKVEYETQKNLMETNKNSRNVNEMSIFPEIVSDINGGGENDDEDSLDVVNTSMYALSESGSSRKRYEEDDKEIPRKNKIKTIKTIIKKKKDVKPKEQDYKTDNSINFSYVSNKNNSNLNKTTTNIKISKVENANRENVLAKSTSNVTDLGNRKDYSINKNTNISIISNKENENISKDNNNKNISKDKNNRYRIKYKPKLKSTFSYSLKQTNLTYEKFKENIENILKELNGDNEIDEEHKNNFKNNLFIISVLFFNKIENNYCNNGIEIAKKIIDLDKKENGNSQDLIILGNIDTSLENYKDNDEKLTKEKKERNKKLEEIRNKIFSNSSEKSEDIDEYIKSIVDDKNCEDYIRDKYKECNEEFSKYKIYKLQVQEIENRFLLKKQSYIQQIINDINNNLSDFATNIDMNGDLEEKLDDTESIFSLSEDFSKVNEDPITDKDPSVKEKIDAIDYKRKILTSCIIMEYRIQVLEYFINNIEYYNNNIKNKKNYAFNVGYEEQGYINDIKNNYTQIIEFIPKAFKMCNEYIKNNLDINIKNVDKNKLIISLMLRYSKLKNLMEIANSELVEYKIMNENEIHSVESLIKKSEENKEDVKNTITLNKNKNEETKIEINKKDKDIEKKDEEKGKSVVSINIKEENKK